MPIVRVHFMRNVGMALIFYKTNVFKFYEIIVKFEEKPLLTFYFLHFVHC